MKKILVVAAVLSVFLVYASFSLIQISRLSSRIAALETATSALNASARDRTARIQEKMDAIEARIAAMQQAAPRPIIDTSIRSIRDLPTSASRF